MRSKADELHSAIKSTKIAAENNLRSHNHAMRKIQNSKQGSR